MNDQQHRADGLCPLKTVPRVPGIAHTFTNPATAHSFVVEVAVITVGNTCVTRRTSVVGADKRETLMLHDLLGEQRLSTLTSSDLCSQAA